MGWVLKNHGGLPQGPLITDGGKGSKREAGDPRAEIHHTRQPVSALD